MILMIISFPAVYGESKQNSEQSVKSKKKEGMSIMPVIAGNSTYGAMFGGAVIHYSSGTFYNKTFFLTVFTTSGQVHSRLSHESISDKFVYKAVMSASNFFESYYGEEPREIKDDPEKIDVTSTNIKPSIAYKFNESSSWGLFLQNKTRQESGIRILESGDELSVRTYDDERSLLTGVFLRYENVKETLEDYAPIGRLVELTVDGLPSKSSTNIEDQETFLRITYDHREYHQLSKSLNLASRLYAGYSFGTPTYLYKYRLGGSDQLRGYKNARFLGKKFWITQFEARYPIYGIVTGNSYVEVGDIGEENFDGLLFVYGTGIKIGLPPDYVAKMRLDFGFSKEGFNISMYTDHAF